MKTFNAVILGGGGTGKSSLTLRYMKEMFVDSYDPTIEESYRKTVKVDGEMCNIEVLDTAGADQFTAMNEYYIKGSAGFILVFSLSQASSMREVEALRQQIFRVKGLPMPSTLNELPPSILTDEERASSSRANGTKRTHQLPRAKSSRSPMIDSFTARGSDERSRSSGEDHSGLAGGRYNNSPHPSSSNSGEPKIPIVIVGTKCDLYADREVSRETAIRMATLWGVPYYETSAKLDLNVNDVFMDILRQMRAQFPTGSKKLPPVRKKKKKGPCTIQ